MTIPAQDPWSAPAVIPTTFPTVQSFHGRLVLLTPRKLEQVPNRQDPRKIDDRMTVDVTVVDGQGPVQLFSQRTPTGQYVEGPDHPGVYMSQSRIVNQLRDALASGGKVLARVGLYKEGQPAGQGNPWGLVDPTEQDAQMARQFLANRTISASIPPKTLQPAPVQALPAQQYAQPVPAPQPVYAQPPQVPAPAAPVAPPAAPQLPQPGSAPVGANPFLGK